MATHILLVETHSDLVTGNVKIGDGFVSIMNKPCNLRIVIIDEVISHIKASQITSSIIATNVKPQPYANNKDDYDVIRHIV